jgi:zinc transporter, ZIP family
MLNLLMTLIAGLFFLVGAFITLRVPNNSKLIKFCVGMAFSVLLLLLFLDILPETLSKFTDYKFMSIMGGVLIGIGLLLILEKMVPHHDHFKEKKHHENHLNHIGIMTAIALMIHNVVEGIGIYGIASTGITSGLMCALGVGMHNIPFGVEITAMLNENKSKKQMWIYITLLTLSTFFGGLLVFIFSNLLSDFVLGSMLSITMGMILYLVFGELLTELKEGFNKYSLFGLLIGILLMLIGVAIE